MPKISGAIRSGLRDGEIALRCVRDCRLRLDHSDLIDFVLVGQSRMSDGNHNAMSTLGARARGLI